MKKEMTNWLALYPHNGSCRGRFETLFNLAYSRRDNLQISEVDFMQSCLDRFGGTMADALIDYLANFLG